MFQGFKGLASRFILTEKAEYVPSPHYLLDSPLFNLDFEEFTQNTLPNTGSQNDLMLPETSKVSVPYKVYEYRQPQPLNQK